MAVGLSAASRVTLWCQGPLRAPGSPALCGVTAAPAPGEHCPSHRCLHPAALVARGWQRFCRASLSVLRGTGFICYSPNQMMTEHLGGALWAGERAMNHVDVNP